MKNMLMLRALFREGYSKDVFKAGCKILQIIKDDDENIIIEMLYYLNPDAIKYPGIITSAVKLGRTDKLELLFKLGCAAEIITDTISTKKGGLRNISKPIVLRAPCSKPLNWIKTMELTFKYHPTHINFRSAWYEEFGCTVCASLTRVYAESNDETEKTQVFELIKWMVAQKALLDDTEYFDAYWMKNKENPTKQDRELRDLLSGPSANWTYIEK